MLVEVSAADMLGYGRKGFIPWDGPMMAACAYPERRIRIYRSDIGSGSDIKQDTSNTQETHTKTIAVKACSSRI
jgi:hypothetical protein